MGFSCRDWKSNSDLRAIVSSTPHACTDLEKSKKYLYQVVAFRGAKRKRPLTTTAVVRDESAVAE